MSIPEGADASVANAAMASDVNADDDVDSLPGDAHDADDAAQFSMLSEDDDDDDDGTGDMDGETDEDDEDTTSDDTGANALEIGEGKANCDKENREDEVNEDEDDEDDEDEEMASSSSTFTSAVTAPIRALSRLFRRTRSSSGTRMMATSDFVHRLTRTDDPHGFRETKENHDPDTIFEEDRPALAELHHRINVDGASSSPNRSQFRRLAQRQCNSNKPFRNASRTAMLHRRVPNSMVSSYTIGHGGSDRLYCAKFSPDGDTFCMASPDGVCLVDTTDINNWRTIKHIDGSETGWSIIDLDYSPDKKWVAYSSWSTNIHLVNATDNRTLQDPHQVMRAGGAHYMCLFSVRFAPNSHELLIGGSQGVCVVYDFEKRKQVTRFEGHHEDVNAVCYLDQSSNLFATGGDDALVKVWDTRQGTSPVGAFIGHKQGITSVATKGDGLYVLSNGKDQRMKLWDMRKIVRSDSDFPYINRDTAHDYRRSYWTPTPQENHRFKNDHSLMTFAGHHRVYRTLMRCNFSPKFSTGQRYVYTACADGHIVIYDVLTGELVQKLPGHGTIIRDVTWHPYESMIVGASWDCSSIQYTYEDDGSCAMATGTCTSVQLDRARERKKARELQRQEHPNRPMYHAMMTGGYMDWETRGQYRRIFRW